MNTAAQPDILMYSTRVCPYCERARALFARKQVSFKEVKVDADPQAFATMMKRSNGRRSVPQIFIGDTHVGGYDDMVALDQAGKLDSLLGIDRIS